MLHNLLFYNQNKKQLIIALTGSMLGILFLIFSVHYSVIINEFGNGKDVLGPNALIVQKVVTNSSTLNLSKTDFSLEEIKKIKNKEYIKDIQPISSNNYDISIETSDPLVPYFRSDIFVQTIPKDLIDLEMEHWDWQKGDKFVPMIMPREFLIMLNTFMSARGIPQISEDLVKEVSFKFKVWKDDKKEMFDVRIIGFTNEVSSILVPKKFMNYGNKQFGKSDNRKITQVLILGEEGKFGLVEDLLTERGLEPKNSQLIVGRLKSIVGTLFVFIFVISLVTVFISLLVLIQYIQLLLSKNIYEIKTLLRLGYDERSLSKIVIKNFNKLFGLVCIISFLLFTTVKLIIDKLSIKGGLYINTSYTSLSILGLILTYILFVILITRVVRLSINKLY